MDEKIKEKIKTLLDQHCRGLRGTDTVEPLNVSRKVRFERRLVSSLSIVAHLNKPINKPNVEIDCCVFKHQPRSQEAQLDAL